jgi:hypothetical protein
VIFEVGEQGEGRANGDREEWIDDCRAMIGDF